MNHCSYANGRRCDYYSLQNISGLSSLLYLKIKGVTLLSSFSGLSNLRQLEISSCNLSKLNRDAFESMPNLESLEIQYYFPGYSLQRIKELNVRNLYKLKQLIVDDTDKVDFLQNLPSELVILKLSTSYENNKECLKFSHSNLKILELSFNDSDDEELDTGVFDAHVFSQLPNLLHLKITFSESFFKKINLDYDFLSRLESFSLEFHEIENLNISRLTNLKSLVLEGKGCYSTCKVKASDLFESVLKTVSQLVSLEELHLISMHLSNSDLGGSFTQLKSLRRLCLSENHLTRIDCKTFAGLENLNGLDVSENRRFENIEPQVFQSVLKELENLFISESQRQILASSAENIKNVHFVR